MNNEDHPLPQTGTDTSQSTIPKTDISCITPDILQGNITGTSYTTTDIPVSIPDTKPKTSPNTNPDTSKATKTSLPILSSQCSEKPTSPANGVSEEDKEGSERSMDVENLKTSQGVDERNQCTQFQNAMTNETNDTTQPNNLPSVEIIQSNTLPSAAIHNGQLAENTQAPGATGINGTTSHPDQKTTGKVYYSE